MKTVTTAMLQAWQTLADRAAEAACVPAALVMRVWPEQIEVLISSLSPDNPYEAHEKADLGTGLYCETVMNTRQPLLVSDALSDPGWADNPDVRLNMISYLGVPLVWPDHSIFGTICVLDRQPRRYSSDTLRLLQLLRAVIEEDFATLVGGPSKGGYREQRMLAFENCITVLRDGAGHEQNGIRH